MITSPTRNASASCANAIVEDIATEPRQESHNPFGTESENDEV